MRSLPVLWLGLLLGVGCQRVTEFCDSDRQCPSGWICGAADRCIPVPSGDGGPDDIAVFAPASCREILTANPQAEDGSYTLYVNHDPSKPWTALCNGMGSDGGPPTEYLTLLMGRDNFSQLAPGVNAMGSTVHTTYWSIRLDPVTLLIDANDQRYASSNGGSVIVQNVPITSMPYGVAAGCNLDRVNSMAHLNLIGTPFIVSSLFGRGVVGSVGQATPSQGGKVVSLTGGGGTMGEELPCGWVAEATGSANLSLAQNPPTGPKIQLGYP